MERDPVVRPDRLRLDPERVAKPRGQRHPPRRVDPPAERGEDADAPVADLVAEPLDDDRAIGGNRAGRRLLLAEVREQIPSGARIEEEVRLQPLVGLCIGESNELAARRADLLPQLVRTADPLALPERNRTRSARSRRDEHAVTGDLLDPPGRGAEHERLPLARLVDHLLVELADATAASDEMDAEKAAIGNRPRIRDREPLRAGSATNHAGRAIPDDPRAQLCELVRRIAPGEHVEHVLELGAGEVGERIRTSSQPMQVVDRDLRLGRDRDDLLREHVEGVSGNRRLLDRALAHRPRDDGALEQVGAELREDATLRDGAELVSGSADALQAARDRLRALDLDHEVDRTHVDPELEARGGDEAGDLPRLQELLDLDPLLAGERAMMRSRDLFLRELVQPEREPLGEPAVVDEDDRRAMRAHELEQGRIDRRPDRADTPLGTRRRGCSRPPRAGSRSARPPGSRMSSTGTTIWRSSSFARAGVDDPDRAIARHEAADLLDRALRGGEADPLGGLRKRARRAARG